jgi:hypothetical protein
VRQSLSSCLLSSPLELVPRHALLSFRSNFRPSSPSSPPILSSLQSVPRCPFPYSPPLFCLRSSSLFSSLHPFVSFSRLSSAFNPYLHHRHDHAEGRNSRSVDPRLLSGTHPLYRTQSPFLCGGSQGLSGLGCARNTQGVNDSELEKERCCL